MRRPRTLRSRLFFWFVGAILLAILTTVLVAGSTRPEAVTGAEAMARNVSTRLASDWDNPEATRAYVAEVRDVTGFDVRLVRDSRKLPPRVHAAVRHGAAIVPENPQHIFVPVVRDGQLAGALEMEKFGPRPTALQWWRFALGLALVGVVLSVMAGRIANLLARPLERLAYAADRFGSGDLGFRADASRARRWVAAEVHDVAVAFNRMADRVEAIVRGQRELLGAISHELRSPLGRARVALEIARDRLPEEPGERSPRAALDDVEKQLGAVDGILGELLDVTRAGLADLRTEARPLAAWLREKIAEDPPPPAIELDVAPEAAEVAPAFDAALLARAVHNLLVNARAHGHPVDAPITVSVSLVDGARVRVVVRDRGPGFAPGVAERAFEPFVRGDAARARPTEGAGYGLGLAIVKRVVEAHGGRVFARNASNATGGAGAPPDKPGTGAEVGFDLPLSLPPR
jgi:two-component system OmpR family sensor kinase